MGNLKNRARTTSRKRKRNQTEVETAKEAKLVKEIGSLEEAPPCSTPEFAVGLTPVVSSVPVLPRQNVSSSSKKLDDVAVPCIDEEEEKGGFVFFSVDVLRSLFSIVSCPGCKSEGVKIKEIPRKKQGLVAAFQMQCSICLWKHEFLSSNYAKEEGKKSKNSFEVNVRAVMAMRNLGIGHDGLESFCMHMNMQQPMTRNNYNKLIDSLHTVYMNEAEQSMKNAAEQVKAKEQSTDITASFDGSWQKPGHASLNGVVSAISVLTGKVLDFQVKSKKCKSCEAHKNMDETSSKYLAWKLDHGLVCGTNHVGSSGKMEVDGILEMFKRSEEKHGLRYISFVGDGDSSTYQTVSNQKPYGEEVTIVKKECVGHVQKRLGTRLRKLKTTYTKRKLADGKAIGGRGRLTDKMIDTMQNYYGLAIRKNKNNLIGMANEVKASLYHLASSEETPQHHLCPKGKDSWCGWQRDFANGTNQYQHKKGLPKAVIDAVIPIYDSLADHTLLSRCLDSYTQNPNESLNNLVWKRCPKKIYQGKKVVELCTASAVATYNDGLASVARVLGQLGIVPGYHTTMGILKRNNARIAIAGLQSTEKGKLRRKKLRAIKKGLWDRNKEKEGPIYESGAH
ncbi:uncharacterized protein LOC135692514 [Rhopilema esculentum]|uniref:uncharacterized protein LOC135692514 n=1 Tax=Rhopilema esculentum TaxID=499914 RepID=UPI0031E1F2FD